MSSPARLHASHRYAPVRRGNFLYRLVALFGLRRQRARLEKLDDHLLRDIGVTRTEARRESGRSFWDAPSHWTD